MHAYVMCNENIVLLALLFKSNIYSDGSNLTRSIKARGFTLCDFIVQVEHILRKS